MSEAVSEVIENVEAEGIVDDTAPVDPSDLPLAEESSPEAEPEVQAETEEELKEEIKEAVEEGATKEEVENMIKEFELKVNGKTIKKTLDLSDEDALKKELQLAAAGQKSMQDLAELKKTYMNEIKRLKENPWEVLDELEIDGDELAEQRLRKKVAELEKSPEQREKEALQRELEQARQALEEKEKAAQDALMEKMANEQEAQLEKDIEDALASNTTLPKSQKTVARIADTMLWCLDNGYPDVTVNDVIPTVEAEIKRELESFFEDMPVDTLETYFGKKNLERLRKARVAANNPNNINNIKPTTKSTEPKEDASPKKKMRAKDYFSNL